MEELIFCEGYEFGFDASKCQFCGGHCCIGESGYIWVNSREIELIAKHLDLNSEEFIEKYLLKLNYRFSLKEKVYIDGFACVFFDEIKKQCSIYKVRPQQCRTFPFWEYFKTNKKELEKECLGVVF